MIGSQFMVLETHAHPIFWVFHPIFPNPGNYVLQKTLEAISTDIDNIGYLPGSFIPNISFKFSAADQEKLVDQLRSLNFQESEIIQFLSLSSFEELIEKFGVK